MRFTTHTDISAPIDYVFEEAADFERFERIALRRGISVEREGYAEDGACDKWSAGFSYRGRKRLLKLEITSFDPPNGFTIGSSSGGLTGSTIIDLVALSKWRTRLGVDVDVRPKTVPARLLIQSLKLGKRRLKRRFEDRVSQFAQEIEAAYRSRES